MWAIVLIATITFFVPSGPYGNGYSVTVVEEVKLSEYNYGGQAPCQDAIRKKQTHRKAADAVYEKITVRVPEGTQVTEVKSEVFCKEAPTKVPHK